MRAALTAGARRGMNRQVLKRRPGAKGPMSIGVKHFNPMMRVNATSSASGPHFTRVGGKRSVRAVALRRTLSLFGLPHGIKRFRSGAMAVNAKHFKPCMCRGSGCISLPGACSPLRIALSRTVRLVLTGHRTRTGGRVGGFSRSTRVRVLGNECKPCVTCGKDGCGVPGSIMPISLGCRAYLRVVGLRDRGTRGTPGHKHCTGGG